MKKVFTILALAVMTFMIISMSACSRKTPPTGTSSGEPTAVSFVLGAHDFFPSVNSDLQTVYDKIISVCENYGSLSYVVVEGDPNQTDSMTLEKSDKKLSSGKVKEKAKRKANAIVNSFASLKAMTPEVDTLQSIRLSADMLSSSFYDTKEMFIRDNGICTTGLLSQLSANVLLTDPEIIADKLEALHALPSLKGISVTWVGIGCVCGDQKRLPPSYQYALKELWTTIIERSGGKVYFDMTPVTGTALEDLPHVTAIEFPEDELDPGNVKETISSVISFKEETIKFVADEANFVDPAKAGEAIAPVAEYLINNPEKKVIIAGTTAKTGTGDGVELSAARAESVRQLLISAGVQTYQIQCLGLGSTDNCLRVEDHNADGTLNEAMAAQNRAIYVILSDSNTAKNLRGEL